MSQQRNPHQGVIRRPRLAFEDGFLMIPNEWARDARIKPQSLGLLVWLMSHAEGFETGISHIASERGIGRDAARTMVGDLERAGYLERVLVRGQSGKFEATEWQLHDPFQEGRNQLPGLEIARPSNENRSHSVEQNPWSEPAPGKPSPVHPTPDNPTPDNPTTKEEHLQEELILTNPVNVTEVDARASEPRGPITPAEAEACKALVDATPSPLEQQARPAWGVQPAPRYPRFKPEPPPAPKPPPRTEAERAEVEALQAEPCPAVPSLRHWFPPGFTSCARECGTALTTTRQEIHA